LKSRFEEGEETRAAAHEHRRLTAHERLELLLDEHSLEEIDGGARFDSGPHGDGVVAGRGAINGRAVYAYVRDLPARSPPEPRTRKIQKTQDLALAHRAPIIGLFESAGARLEEGVAALTGFGEILQRHVQASGVIPQISLITGVCAGAGAFAPALTDFLFMVEATSGLFVTGPAIIGTVANESVTAEEFGGAAVHAAAGKCDRAYASDFEALLQLRRLIDFLPASNAGGGPEWPSFDSIDRIDPSLDSLVPDDPHKPYDIKEAIAKTLDEGDFFEIQEAHARNIVTGFGRVDGRTVGVVANQPLVLAGVLDCDAARKAARFVRFCDCFAVPIVTFVDAPGFLPGVAQEQGGLVKDGAKLAFAYAEGTAPKVAIVTRHALGGAGLLMGSKALGADAVFAWPSASIGLIGAKGAADLMAPREAGDPAASADRIRAYEQRFLSPQAAARQGAIDAVIEPRATRKTIAAALAARRREAAAGPWRRHGDIPF
jgi:propionyl-CoA carboxylase beta chain